MLIVAAVLMFRYIYVQFGNMLDHWRDLQCKNSIARGDVVLNKVDILLIMK